MTGYGVRIKLKNEHELHLSQLGYGITQLLPIILQIAVSGAKVMIVEEPESNLHPALQSKLADMFAEAGNDLGIQFIIETHSEYFIRRFQLLIANSYAKSEKTH